MIFHLQRSTANCDIYWTEAMKKIMKTNTILFAITLSLNKKSTNKI